MNLPRPSLWSFLLAASLLAAPASSPAPADAPYVPDFTPQPAVKALTPEEELKTIELPEGYRLELVLSERDGIREPANLTFDGNGRMYIAELRTYMQDIDGKNEHDPVGVISRHESTQRDGKFDKHTLYRDKMLLPRMVLPLQDEVLIGVTDTNDIEAWRAYMTGAGFVELTHYFRPEGLPREQQPWLASVWRK